MSLKDFNQLLIILELKYSHLQELILFKILIEYNLLEEFLLKKIQLKLVKNKMILKIYQKIILLVII